MDYDKIGTAIAYLRKRAGYTQRELAERIGISDKAVSKWERGLALPDISCLTKLSILLDTDTDSLLAGDEGNHEKGWCGYLSMEENPNGIYSGSMLFDKPLVYYLLSLFMLVGIKHIFISCPKKDQSFIQANMGDGTIFGICLMFIEDNGDIPDMSGFTNLMCILGREFIYGVDQTRFFQKAMMDKERTTILSLPRSGSSLANGIFFDDQKKIVDYDDSDRVITQYDYHAIPIFFCPCNRFHSIFLKGKANFTGEDVLYTEVLDRGYVEMPLNSWKDMAMASEFVRIVQDAGGMELYCMEEIAWRRGFISTEKLRNLGELRKESLYGRYILNLID